METKPGQVWRQLPNALTFTRLVLTPIVCGLISVHAFLPALAAFVLGAATDWFDGYLARRFGVASAFGRQLDPIVDKVFVTCTFLYLLTLPEDTGLMPWMVAVVLVRELIVSALRSLIEGRGEPFGARMAGKLKATFQFLAVIAILLGLAYAPSGPWLWARDGLIWIAVALTIYSGLSYLHLAWPILRKGSAPPSSLMESS